MPSIPIRLAGDGICAAIGEHWRGAGRGFADVLAVVVSTGVGGGLIQDDKVVFGASGNAGHIGHQIVDLNGPKCDCGGRGCVETMACGPAMVEWALDKGWRSPVTELSAAEPTAIDLATTAREGDRIAQDAFRRAGRALAAGIVSTAAVCDLTRVVIGGGVAHAADVLFPAVRAAIGEYAHLGFLQGITIEAAELGTSAGLIGAAAMVFEPDRYFRVRRPKAVTSTL